MGRANRATRAEVASLAGVSTATVSYVVNGGPKPVAAETKARVLRAIAQLDYVPNDFARSLKGVGSSTIGYLVPNIRNPFFAEMTSAFNKALRQRGYQLLLADLDDDPSREAEYLELFRKKDVDGVVAWQIASSESMIDFLSSRGIPFALIATRHPQACSAVIDEKGAAEIAVAHLKALGHRRIGFIGPGDQEHFPQSRLPFIQKALASTGLPSSRGIFFDTSTSGGWTYAAQRLIGAAERPTAAIVHNDDLAIRIVAHLIDLGFEVPDDISILSYDDLDISRYTKVPLTSIGYSKEELGRLAIDLVLRQIEGADIGHSVMEVPVELIVRDFTGRPPAASYPAA